MADDGKIDENLTVPSDQDKQTGSGQDEQLKQLQDRVASLEDQLKRAVADYHNLEKRVSEARVQLADWTSAELIKSLLPVLHHLDTALTGASEEERKSGWFKGVSMSVVEFKNVLKNEGLEEVDTKNGFDPSIHEAIDMREGEDNQVLEVLEKGYNLKGKVLKPAKVVVGKKINKPKVAES